MSPGAKTRWSTRESGRTTVPPPDPSQFEGKDLEAYKWIVAREARKSEMSSQTVWKDEGYPYYGLPFYPYYGAMLNSPRMAKKYAELSTFFVDAPKRGSFSAYEVEFVDVVLAHELKTDVALVHHVEDCVAHGGDPEALRAIWRGSFDKLSPADHQLADFISAVARGAVTEQMWAAMEDRRGRKTTVELAGYVCYKLMAMRCQQALGGPEPGEADIEKFFDDLIAGAVPLPDPSWSNSWTQGED